MSIRKVRAYKRERVEVEITEREICQEAAHILMVKHNLVHGSYLNESDMIITIYERARLEEEHGKATPEQKAVYQAIEILLAVR